MDSSSAGHSVPTHVVPSDGLKGLKENWRGDLVSGLLVALIALPLCLGIALASGFPAFGGVVTAIVGGIIVGPLCGSPLTIKGPAAGLIAIAISSVEAFGQGNLYQGYRCTLAVIVVASVIQILFALFRLGRFADFFPASVIHGMLASIGIIIISKQIHPLLGVKALAREPIPLLLEIPHSLVKMNPEVALVGILSVIIVVLATTYFGRLARILPGPLVAVFVGIGLCLFFDFRHPHTYGWYEFNYTVDQNFLVTLPGRFFSGITFPDLSQLLTADTLKYVLLFSLIGSLEALLTDKSIDNLDPAGRKSNMNRDLFAIGVGNLVCGLIGGLPMISEVVRSSANIVYGAKTRWANFFHGLCILSFVVVLTPVIQLIPNAALAGILVVTGFRLASPKQFRHSREIGYENLFIFTVTIIVTLLTDLLMGVLFGMVAEYVVCWALGAPLSALFRGISKGRSDPRGTFVIELPEACTFGNVISLKREVASANNSPITIDFSKVVFVDHTFMHELRVIERENKTTLVGLEELTPLSSHRDATRRRNKPIKKRVGALG